MTHGGNRMESFICPPLIAYRRLSVLPALFNIQKNGTLLAQHRGRLDEMALDSILKKAGVALDTQRLHQIVLVERNRSRLKVEDTSNFLH